MRILLAGVAAIALAATGATAQGKGNENGQGKSHASAQNKGNGNGKGKADDRGENRGKAKQESRQRERRDGRNENRREERMDDRRDAQRERVQDRRQAERRDDRTENFREANRERAENRREDRTENRRDDMRDDRRRYADDRRDTRRFNNEVEHNRLVRLNEWRDRDRARTVIAGCPPGLAKKRNGCTPPGQLRERALFGYEYRPRLFGLTSSNSGRYYYDDGYLFRLSDRGSIAGFIPLLGGALSVGNPWPSSYDSYDVPDYYVDYYNLGGQDRYRYANDVIYRVNPENTVITAIAALLTGDQFAVGQPAPMGYDVYNVPYGYQDRYYDTPDANYRYSDGYVYQIDPKTRLVAAAIDLLV